MSKKLILSGIIAVVALAFIIVSCNRTPSPTEQAATPISLAKMGTGLPDIFAEGVTFCGDYKTVDLWAGQHIDAGSVTIYNDETNLYITVYSEYGYQDVSENIKIWAGEDLLNMPANQQGIPDIGHFPYKYTVDPATQTTFTAVILLNDLAGVNQCGDEVFIVVHADVKASEDGGTTITNETAFGGDTPGSGNRWWYYTIFEIQCCGSQQFDYCETAFAKGGWVFVISKKANPENLPSLELIRNRWGWAINLTATGTTTYEIWAGAGLNDISKGLLVGELTVTWDGSEVTVTYNMAPGKLMQEVHIYAGDNEPWTTAPGQYGYTEYFDPMVSTRTAMFDVSDTNNDGIWIIAHAIVCW